jgi:hypothetical protein
MAPNLLHHAEAPFGKDLPAVNAERPISVEQSLAAWLMSGAQIYAQAKYCGDRCRKAASRERISRDKKCEKTQKGSRTLISRDNAFAAH